MAHELRGAAAVTGIGLTDFGELPGRSHLEIMAEAVHHAVNDAGIQLHDIDGVFGSNFADALPALNILEYLGLRPKFMDGTNIGGSSFSNSVQSAALALKTGIIDTALIAYGSDNRSQMRNPTPGRPNVSRGGRAQWLSCPATLGCRPLGGVGRCAPADFGSGLHL